MRPSTLRFFDRTHLPAHLQEIVRPFAALAHEIADRGGDPAEVHAAIRKLLEAKDCAVRAAIPVPT